MKLREIKVRNFRSLVDVTVPIEDTTVLVGENNSGKTTLLHALRAALTRSAQARSNVFDEFDYHVAREGDTFETSEGIVIELWFREDAPDEWPAALTRSLDEIVQTDPVRDIDCIGLRLSGKYDLVAREHVTTWDFLAVDGEVLAGKGVKALSTFAAFLSYIRLFYLVALRNSQDEFAPRSQRSQFWGPILRKLEISEDQKRLLSAELSRINDDLLQADPRLEEVRAELDNVHHITTVGAGKVASIQALPLRHTELMSRSQVVIKGRGNEIDFPVSHHGQGIQSLAVLFLFQAYINVFLKPSFKAETEAILALEEPEAHLHPHATRSLANYLQRITAQKIVTTHSPYFIQGVPFTQIRMFRQIGAVSKVLYIKRSFAAAMPPTRDLLTFVANNKTKFEFNSATSSLVVHGTMSEDEFRSLVSFYPSRPDVHGELRRLMLESQTYLNDAELAKLGTDAKRMRGEILFARAWLLCEGQSDHALLHYFAELLGTPFDNAGITVIDFQNNGSPGIFVRLAQAFEIPWMMICDNDDGGKRFVKQVQDCGLSDAETKELARTLPGEGMDLENYLCTHGFLDEYAAVLAESARPDDPIADAWSIAKTSRSGSKVSQEVFVRKDGSYQVVVREGDYEETFDKGSAEFNTYFMPVMIEKLKRDKVGSALALIERLRSVAADASRVPLFLREAISAVIGKAV